MRTSRFSRLTLASVALLLVSAARGERPAGTANRWSSLGPYGRGAGIAALGVVNDGLGHTRAHLATSTGVFRSFDAGASWSPSSDGVSSTTTYTIPLVSAFVADPQSPSIVYAAGSDGVFRSDDEGATWRVVNQGLNGEGIRSLAIDRLATSTLFGANEGGVFRTIDGGASWEILPAAPGVTDAAGLAMDPTSSSILYAAFGAGVYKSIDAGRSWTFSGAGITETNLRFVRVDPATPSVLYAGDTRIFKSVDSGATWTAADSGLPGRRIGALAIDPGDPRTILAGVTGFSTGGGIWRTTDGGAHWAEVAVGLAPTGISALGVDPVRGSRVLAAVTRWELSRGEYGSILASDDFGATWAPRDLSVQGRYVQPLAISRDGATLYAMVADNVPWLAPSELWRTSDGGAHWERGAETGLAGQTVRALAIDPDEPSILLAGTDSGIFESRDSGETWFRLPGSPPSFTGSLVIDISATAALIYAGGDYGVVKSFDGGATFAPAGNGTTGPVSTLYLDGRDRSLYAGVQGGIFRLRNGDWSALTTSLGGRVTSLAFDATSTIVATTVYTGPLPDPLPPPRWVFRSSDSGSTWLQVSNVPQALAVLADPANPSRMFLASTNAGIFRSVDSGATWTGANAGLTSLFASSLAMAPGSPVYAATLGGGIFSARFVDLRRPVPREIPFRGQPAPSPKRANAAAY